MARILIVEDEVHITRVLSLWLGRHGHLVVEASNGAAALELLDREPVDMIISDMNMPVLDGLGLVKAVREERHLDIPFLLVTARCDQSSLAESLQPYDVKVLPKPFVPSRIAADVEQMLGPVTT